MEGFFFLRVEGHYWGVLLHMHMQFPPFPLCALTPLSSYTLWHSSQCALTAHTVPDPLVMHLPCNSGYTVYFFGYLMHLTLKTDALILF